MEIVAYARQFLPFDSSIRVNLNFALRKREKLNNLLPQFFCVYTSQHLIDTYSSFCVIAGGEIFSHSHVLLVFFCSTDYMYSITSLTLSNSSTKLLANQILHSESYPIFIICIKRCAIAYYNLLLRCIENKHKVITSAFCKGNIRKTVKSFIISIKTVGIRRKTILF